MKANKSIVYILTSAVAFVLLLAVASAAALTNPAPAHAATTAATAQTALTPAAAAASPVSSAGEDIRDIRQPRHVPAPLLWTLIAAGVATSLSVLVFWRLLRQAPILELSPQERALDSLEEARLFMNPEHAREYCFAVSQIIRVFLEDQLSLHAPRLTTEEFLRELMKGQDKIAGTQRGLLCDVLSHCDLAKFAGWHYPLAAMSALHDTAVEFVQQSANPATTPPVVENPLVSVPENNRINPISVNTNIPAI
ncbi:MAG TPA: hypothetical protein VNN22_16080 [Verrucomicrobiae bacterium]|nr:hypothetical protein [Verrucomicrobiae bacterium]